MRLRISLRFVPGIIGFGIMLPYNVVDPGGGDRQNAGIMEKTTIVTGGAGFIGSALVRALVAGGSDRVVNVDNLAYSGNLDSVKEVSGNSRYHFEQQDICDSAAMRKIFEKYKPHRVFHLAAESHVDRSIDNPGAFLNTNVQGTFVLLEMSLRHYKTLTPSERDAFRFVHISTDEVYGSLKKNDPAFTEHSLYQPNSPYSASKAASDHVVRAWHETYGLPTLTTHCSNNYGPFQFPEKLIPLCILKAVQGLALPIYGTGDNVRDWLYVDDHVRALITVAEKGVPGSTYNIGGKNERTNLELVHTLCSLLDEAMPNAPQKPFKSLIKFVADRPGHDKRYAIDSHKLETQLGWQPQETPETGLKKTVDWYIKNIDWCKSVQQQGNYQGERLGLGK